MTPDGTGALRATVDAPIEPFRLADDTVVFDEGRWHMTVNPSSSWHRANEVLSSELDPTRVEQQIDAIEALYRHLGLAWSWCVYPWDQPDDLSARSGACFFDPTRVARDFAGGQYPMGWTPLHRHFCAKVVS